MRIFDVLRFNMTKAVLIALILLAALGVIAYRYRQKASQTNGPEYSPRTADEPTYEDTCEILTRNGYIAENHDITTADGYRLNVVRGRNPLIDYDSQDVKNKQPVLLVHPKQSSSEIFVVRLQGARPRNLSKVNINEYKGDEGLGAVLNPHSPNSQTLVSLLLDLGHEVWLLDRRGASYRMFNNLDDEGIWYYMTGGQYKDHENYWNYTLDEEVRYDLPQVIDLVLNVTNRPKISLVGHSTGGALILMALAKYPELSERSKYNLFIEDGV